MYDKGAECKTGEEKPLQQIELEELNSHMQKNEIRPISHIRHQG